jgi:hypothetical protein
MADGNVPKVTDELRQAWAHEEAIRNDPNTELVVEQLLASDNENVVKVTKQYYLGLLTHAEFEYKIRELL